MFHSQSFMLVKNPKPKRKSEYTEDYQPDRKRKGNNQKHQQDFSIQRKIKKGEL